jgi:hypothetical protein
MRHATMGRFLALVLLAGGCGSSSTDQTSKFVGTWTFDTGSADATCMGLGNFSIPLAGLSGTITRVDDSHIQLAASTPCGPGSCTIKYSVSGMTATAESGQMCSLPVQALGGSCQAIAISSWTMTLSGSTLSASIMGTALVCTATGTGTLTMHPPSDGGAVDSSTGG